MRKSVLLVAVLCFLAAGVGQAGKINRVAFKNVSSIALQCVTSAPSSGLEANIRDIMLTTLRSRLPKIKIDNMSNDILRVAATISSNRSMFVETIKLSFLRPVKVEGEHMLATVYAKSYILSGSPSELEAKTKEKVNDLLTQFIADFYRARSDL